MPTNRSLPLLRQELTLHKGATQADGQPSWVLHDPSSNRFYELGWASFEMLSRWELGSAQAILDSVSQDTTLHLDEADIAELLHFLSTHQLLQAGTPQHTTSLLQRHAANHPGQAMWLLKHYLFFRLPLFRPEPLLGKIMPWVGWAFDTRFWRAMIGVLLLALLLVSRRWDAFMHTFSGYKGWTALLGVGLSLSIAKVLHEMGHALTARRFGCRVPSMGVAFLVLAPVLYTDTNDAWKLPARRSRLLIAAAGMLAELLLAVWATLLWCVMPDGPWRAGVFLLASTTWVATLVVNASPFMRFDGYFLLSDWLGMPNLHQRAFDLARWHLRRVVLGIDDAPPEAFPPRRHAGLLLFAWATWVYRLVLFLSIAWLVYHLFFKTLGLILLMVELGWFIARPVASELRVWWERRDTIHWSPTTRRSSGLALVLLTLVVYPWQTQVMAPAVLKAAQSQGLYAPVAGEVTTVLVHDGEVVKAGQILLTMRSSALDAQLALALAKERELARQVAQQPFNAEWQSQGPALAKQWRVAQEEVRSLSEQQARLRLTAPFDGRVVDLSEAAKTDTTLAEGEHLFDLVGLSGARIDAFVDETDLPRLQVGRTAHFVADSGERHSVRCMVSQVDRLALATLEQPLLSSVHGGPLPSEERPKGLTPLSPTFMVRLTRCGDDGRMAPPGRETVGVAQLGGERRSLAGRALSRFMAAVQSEAAL